MLDKGSEIGKDISPFYSKQIIYPPPLSPVILLNVGMGLELSYSYIMAFEIFEKLYPWSKHLKYYFGLLC